MKILVEIPDVGGFAEAFAEAHSWDQSVPLEDFIRGVLLGYIKAKSQEALVSRDIPVLVEQKRAQVDAADIKVQRDDVVRGG